MSKKAGLYNKYDITKQNGTEMDPRAEYFVLRHDPFGDHCHIEASREALRRYAEMIQPYYPQLAKDIFKKLSTYTTVDFNL